MLRNLYDTLLNFTQHFFFSSLNQLKRNNRKNCQMLLCNLKLKMREKAFVYGAKGKFKWLKQYQNGIDI